MLVRGVRSLGYTLLSHRVFYIHNEVLCSYIFAMKKTFSYKKY